MHPEDSYCVVLINDIRNRAGSNMNIRHYGEEFMLLISPKDTGIVHVENRTEQDNSSDT